MPKEKAAEANLRGFAKAGLECSQGSEATALKRPDEGKRREKPRNDLANARKRNPRNDAGGGAGFHGAIDGVCAA